MEGNLVDLDVPDVRKDSIKVEKATPRAREGTLVDLDVGPPPVVVGKDPTTETTVEEKEIAKEPQSKLCGYLNKKGDRGLVKVFRQRWFVFEPRRCRLYYYKSSEDATALGSIDIAGASFSFDQGEQEGRAGHFEISSADRTFVLQAADHSTMMFWLQELQLRRRHYSQLRTSMARTFSTSAMASASVLPPKSGLLKQQGTPQEPSTQYQTVAPLINIDETSKGLATVNTNVSLTSDNGPEAKRWSADLENKHSDHQGHAKVMTSQPPPSPTRSGVNRMSGFASSLKKKLSGNRAVNQTENSATGSVPQNQENLLTLQDKVETLEQELEANQKVIKILHEQLSSAQQEKRSSDHFVQAGSEKERLELVRQKDRQLAELQKQLNETKMEREDMRLDLKLSERSSQELKEQLMMFQEMLQAKDQVIIQLTHQVDDLEHGQTVPTDTGDNSLLTIQQHSNPVSTADWMDDTQNLKDSLEAFKTQNRFLNNEILELNLLRNDDATREQLHLEKMSELEARYYQIKSKYLLLLNELHTPQRGGEESRTQEVISQLLDEAINVEGNEPVETAGRLQPLREEKFDRYGFSMEADLAEANPVVSRAGSLLRRSEEIQARSAEENISIGIKWENYFANIGDHDPVRLPELKSLIRAGIPHEYRERIWNWCVRLRVQDSRSQADGAAPNKSHYQHLHITNRGKFNPAGKQIELDLMRTLPHNVHYGSMESEGIQKLRRVLVAYSWHNPAIGYCQGLNRIVAIALLFMTEEDAFWCLVAIVEHIMPQDYFSKTLAGSQVDQRVFKDLLKEKLPHLSSHLDNYNVDLSLATFNWFLTIFVDGIPTDTMLRIWDAFLYEGSKVLFRYALAFFKASEEAILQQKDYMSIFKFLRQMPQTMVDTRRLAQIAFHDLNPFPRRNINARRLFHKENVWAELRELDAIREDFTSSYEQKTTDFLSDDES
ncbi:TBC1 domain family member 2B-like [Branchiostoma floridae]|uniref:TBC1 domain family member 2B-like n=1 Tax=Branchiostoma floridae TaxID=7739 RepID=A0A9J7L1Q8_BRAFL|nr:TBC1 domain family member 2B-like [Branchiostoma floridae]